MKVWEIIRHVNNTSETLSDDAQLIGRTLGYLENVFGEAVSVKDMNWQGRISRPPCSLS